MEDTPARPRLIPKILCGHPPRMSLILPWESLSAHKPAAYRSLRGDGRQRATSPYGNKGKTRTKRNWRHPKSGA